MSWATLYRASQARQTYGTPRLSFVLHNHHLLCDIVELRDLRRCDPPGSCDVPREACCVETCLGQADCLCQRHVSQTPFRRLLRDEFDHFEFVDRAWKRLQAQAAAADQGSSLRTEAVGVEHGRASCG